MSDTHRLADGSFRNPWPDSDVPGWLGVPRVLVENVAGRLRTRHSRVALEKATPTVAYPRAHERAFTATWIGHSTVLLQIGGLNVLTDPVFCRRASPVQWMGPARMIEPALEVSTLPPIDVVLISHNHYDHLDKAAVRELAALNPDTTWVVPLGLGSLIRRWGANEVVELDWWQRVEVSGLEVTATPAQHFSGRGVRDRNRTLWCGYALAIAGWRGLFAGDTAYHDEFAEIGARCGPFDFVMLPIGAYEPRWFMRAVHMNPEEAVRVYQDLISAHAAAAPPLMLAVHWGTFRLTHEPVDEPPRRAAACWEATGARASHLWLPRCGETRRVREVYATPAPPRQ
jgi:N-acyl-phosphatidylethanolamine-hydrolysing phospholipase D